MFEVLDSNFSCKFELLNTSCLSSLCLALAQLRREEGREGVEVGRVALGEGRGLGGRRGGIVQGGV